MARIVWIASYPKSGNTWVRFLIANLLYKRISCSADVHRLVPDIHRYINSAHLLGDRTTFIKTHWKYHNRLPLREDTVGVVYIVRNPLDVIASGVNYFVLRKGDQYLNVPSTEQGRIRESYIDEFIELGGAREWIKLGMGSWLENVSSWHSKEMPFARIIVRYEDLQDDPTKFLVRICEFLSLNKSSEEVNAAVTQSSFASLREMESRELSQKTPGVFTLETPEIAYKHGLRFMNKGRVNDYNDILTESQIAAATSRFGHLMKRLGYAE